MIRDRRRVLAHTALALAIWAPFLVKSVRKLHRTVSDPDRNNDFTIFWNAGSSLLDGSALYAEGFMYPPFFACLMLPLALLPALVAGIIWLLAKIPLFYASVRVLLPSEGLTPRQREWLVALSPLLVYRNLDNDLATGNSNVYLLAGMAGTLALLRRGRPWAAGLLAAAVTCVKLSPLYVGAALLVSGQRRFALAALVCMAAYLLLPPLVVPGGPTAVWQGMQQNTLAVAFVLEDHPGEAHSGYLAGTSLRPILHRWLTDSHAVAHAEPGVRRTIHVLALPRETVEWLYRALAAGIAVLGLAAVRGRGLRWTLAWSMVLLLVISPYARKAQFMFLLPALLLVARSITLRGFRADPWLSGLFVACLACGQLSTRGIWGRGITELLLAWGFVLFSALSILPALWIIRRDEHDT